MAVTSVSVARAVNAEQYANYLRKTITYRIICSSDSDGPDIITANASIPQIDSSTYTGVFKYGSDNDNAQLICRKHSNLRRIKSTSAWLLDAEFEYDLDKDPVSRGVVVTPMTRVDRRIVRMAEFKGWYELKTTQTGASDYDNLQVLDGTFTGAVVQENKQSVIMNSAGTPLVPPVEQDVGSQIWAVEWLKESGVNYDDYIGRTNSSSFTIVSATQNIDTTFAAGQLKVLAASQTPTWIYNRHLFLTRVELEIVPAGSYGDIFELDQGLAEKLYLGDDDGKGGEVDSVSLPRHKLRVIEDGGKPISHPVPFDGAGKLIPNFEPKDLVYLRWRTAPPFNFSALQIGDYD